MSYEQDRNAAGNEALSVLRDIWQARAQSTEDVDEACGVTKSCKSMEQVGFGDFTEDRASDLTSAWRAQLKREGKFNPEASSVRDLLFGSAEQNR